MKGEWNGWWRWRWSHRTQDVAEVPTSLHLSRMCRVEKAAAAAAVVVVAVVVEVCLHSFRVLHSRINFRFGVSLLSNVATVASIHCFAEVKLDPQRWRKNHRRRSSF